MPELKTATIALTSSGLCILPSFSLSSTERGTGNTSSVNEKEIENIKRQLSVRFVSKVGNKVFPIELFLYKQKGPITFYARYSGLGASLRAKGYAVEFENRLPPFKPIPVVNSLETQNKRPLVLYPNQQIVHDYLIGNILNEERRLKGVASCVLVLPTGSGKTYTAGAIMRTLNTTTLIVVPNKLIMDEWRKMLHNFKIMSNPAKIGEYSSIRKIDGDIVIMTAKSLIKPMFFEKKYWEYLKKFNLVIYDEIHNYATTTQQEIFWRTHTHYNLGLTATPDERLDEMDEIYIKHVGRLISTIDIPNYEAAAPIPWKGRVKVLQYHGPLQFTHDIKNADGWTQAQSMQKQFATDPYRTKLILDQAMNMLKRNKNVFIFGEHRDFMDLLCAKINEIHRVVGSVTTDICGVLKGGVKESELKRIAQLPIICITYCYGKEGVSIPKMTAIIFGQSRRNKMRQILGRILRAGGDPEEEREIVDIVDQRTSIKSQLPTRMLVYKDKNFIVEKKKVLYTDIPLPSMVSTLPEIFKELE